jgi:hypothetical protein
VLLFLVAATLGFSGIITFAEAGQMEIQSSIFFIVFGFMGCLLATAAVISIMRFTNNPFVDEESPTSLSGWKIATGIVATGLALWVGNFLQDKQSINWLALPLLTVPAVAVPVWLFVRLGAKDLPLGSRWRRWGAFGLSISLTPFILFVLEIIVVVLIVVLFIFYVGLNPDLSTELQTLSRQFRYLDPGSEDIVKLIAPFLTRPGVIIPAILFFSVIIPMMEEALKPLVVWLFAGKLNSQAQGFALGALCGAGFALVETFNNSAQSDAWASVLLARIGTGAMHITTSALIGAAIFSAWHERQYLRLFSTYFLSVFLHGFWNLLAVASGFSSLLVESSNDNYYQIIARTSEIGLAILTLILIAILVISNRKQPRMLETTHQP